MAKSMDLTVSLVFREDLFCCRGKLVVVHSLCAISFPSAVYQRKGEELVQQGH